jgi:Transcriptional regulators of sugar metabolism
VASRVVIVADSTKVGKSTFARICELEKIDTLVTDAPVASPMREAFDLAGVEVIVAD